MLHLPVFAEQHARMIWMFFEMVSQFILRYEFRLHFSHIVCDEGLC